MPNYLLDTNIVLRLSNPSDRHHTSVVEAIAILLEQGNECYLSPQILTELWVVATRPTDVNGLGWSTDYVRKIIDELLGRFPFVDETPQIFPIWLDLVTRNDVRGKRTHDIRVIALMNSVAIHHILTLNPNDFSGISNIIVVTPQEILARRGT